MTDQSNLDTYIDHAAAAIDLNIDPAYRPSVIEYFRVVTSIATLVNAFPLGPETDNAAVFIPCSTLTQE